MRTLALLSIALAATFAQAAVINKRVTAPVATEITDLQTIVTQLQKLTTEVNGYTASQGYTGALKINGDESTLETDIKKATTDCNAITGTVSEADATAVFAEVALLVPQVQAALQAIVNKKPVFDTVLLVTPLVKGDLQRLQPLTASLDSCLLSHTPSDQTATAQGYINQINAAFTAACSAYGATC
ncbi:hydrophobic surface binding protein A-domain-containing protein [Umbelopsis sp. AD052]|nr:hydrophobic surface binding protein A-domain-containing protein [Umbelopsis sp. AD052]